MSKSIKDRLMQEAIDNIKDFLEKDDDRPEDEEGVRYGYMCSTDFDHELGYAMPDTPVYPSIKSLVKQRKCCTDEGACGIYRVRVVIDKVIRPFDWSRE